MKITTKIAITSLKQNKSKSILIGIAISLTTMLLTILGLSGNGLINYNMENVKNIYGEYHGTFKEVKIEQLNYMLTHGEFKNIGRGESFALVQSSNMKGSIGFIDDAYAKGLNFALSKGKMPHKQNEVVAEKEFFEALGYKNPSVGGIVKIPYRVDGQGKILEKEFVISGISKTDELSNLRKSYRGIVSEEFYNNTIPKEHQLPSVIFKTQGEESLNNDEITEKIKKLAGEVGIKGKSISINTGYLRWATDPGMDIIAGCIGIGVVIILFSILVIYNIFHVGVVQKVQEYGKLKAIGTTKKQLKSIILKEGMLLSLISIPLGLIVGYIASQYFFTEIVIKKLVDNRGLEAVNTSLFSAPILFLVVVFSLITVYLSIRKPMKIVCKISSIEAIVYREKALEKSSRKGYQTMSLFKLTISNLMRNKKRTITTILTMGLSSILLVVVINVAGNMDPSYSARHYVEKGDFVILLNYHINDETYPEKNLHNMQKQNLMNSKFMKSVEEINGVSKVETMKEIQVKVNKKELKEEEKYAIIEVLSRENFNSRQRFLQKGEMDYEKASRENGIIYEWDAFFHEFGYKLGEKLDITMDDGDKKVPFNFTLQGSARSAQATYIITEDTFNKLNIKGDMTTKIFVTCEKGEEAKVGEKLKALMKGNNSYELREYEGFLKMTKLQINVVKYPAYGLLVVIGIIGFMNMANTLITSIIVRKREIGMLQAIGLTRAQLNKMLQMEGLIFTLGILGISLTLGNLLGYTAFVNLKTNGIIGLNEYHFPILELGIMITVLGLLQIILSFSMSKRLQSESLIDRIKY